MRRALLACLVLLGAAAGLAGPVAEVAVAADDVPKIRALNPTSGFRGGTVDVALEGQNLHPYDELKLSRGEISSTVMPGANASRVVLRLVIPDTVPAGPVTVTLKTKTGVVKKDFTVKLRTPTVAKVAPTSVVRGGEVDLRVEGLQLVLAGQDTRVVAEAPMTAKVVGKPTATSLTVRLVVPPETPVGGRTVTVETADGKVTTTVTVLYATPSVTGLAPASVARGAGADLVLAGTNLAGARDVVLAVADPSVVVTARGAPTATAVPLRVEVRPDAAPGPRLLVVRTPDGLVSKAFDVTTPVPALAALKPAGGARGAPVAVVPTAADAPGGFALRVLPADPAVVVERQPSGAWQVVLAPDAAPGPRSVVLDHPFGAAVAPFTVSVRTPTVTGLTPAEVAPGAEADVAVDGQWLDGAVVTLAAPDPAVTIAPKAAGVVHVKVAPDARPGRRPLVVRTRDGAAVAVLGVPGAGAAGPAVREVLPGRVGRGRPTELVLSGVNLRGAGDQPPEVTATLGDAGVPVTVVKSTALDLVVRVEPPAGAPAGGCVVVVRTADGVAAGVTLVAPSAPVVTAVRPGPLRRPGDWAVVVEGTDLVGPAGTPPTVVLARPDGTDPMPAVVGEATATRVALTVPVPAAAVPGPRVLLVSTTEGGAAAALPLPADVPALVSWAPLTVGVPASVVLTLEGRNLRAPGGLEPKVGVQRLGASSSARVEVLEAADDRLRLRVLTPPGSTTGPHVLTVKTPDGLAAAVFDVVDAPMPTVSALTPAAGGRLSTVTVTVEGTGLLGASAVTFSGAGVTAVLQPGSTATKLLLRVTVAKDAAPGPRTLSVTAPGGIATPEKLVFTVE